MKLLLALLLCCLSASAVAQETFQPTAGGQPAATVPVAPAPVYAAPAVAPVYAAPAPYAYPAPVYAAPAPYYAVPAYAYPPPYYYGPRFGIGFGWGRGRHRGGWDLSVGF